MRAIEFILATLAMSVVGLASYILLEPRFVESSHYPVTISALVGLASAVMAYSASVGVIRRSQLHQMDRDLQKAIKKLVETRNILAVFGKRLHLALKQLDQKIEAMNQGSFQEASKELFIWNLPDLADDAKKTANQILDISADLPRPVQGHILKLLEIAEKIKALDQGKLFLDAVFDRSSPRAEEHALLWVALQNREHHEEASQLLRVLLLETKRATAKLSKYLPDRTKPGAAWPFTDLTERMRFEILTNLPEIMPLETPKTEGESARDTQIPGGSSRGKTGERPTKSTETDG